MKAISLNKIFAAASIAVLAGLFFAAVSFRALPPLLVAVPNAYNIISVHALESLNDQVQLAESELKSYSRLLLTYEQRRAATITALQRQIEATLIYTNHSYGFVLGFPLASGRFFDRTAVAEGHNIAVLNETAAFEIFGTTDAVGNELQIRSALYRVAGVLIDGAEERHIYLPITRLANHTDSAAIAASLGQSEEEALALLQQIGISHTSHDFVNIAALQQAAMHRFIFALQFFAGLILIFGIKKALAGLFAELRNLKSLSKEKYAAELAGSRHFWKSAGFGGLALALTAGFAVLGLDAFGRALAIYDTVGGLVPFSGFGGLYVEVVFWNSVSWVLFWAGLLICSLLPRTFRHPQSQL